MNKYVKYHIVTILFLVLCINSGMAEQGASKRLWSTYLSPLGMVRADWEESASLACNSDTIFAASLRGIVAAIDAGTGQIKWRTKIKGILPYGIAVDEHGVYLGLEDGTFRSYSLIDGSEQWRMELRSAVVSAPSTWNGLVYFIIGDDTLYAVDVKTGKWKWHFKRDTRKKMTILGLPRPVIADAKVFVGTSDGLVAALDALTGKLLWGKRPDTERRRFEDVDSTPVITEKAVFLATYDGKSFGIERESGNVLWSFDDGSIEPLAMAGNLLIISGQDNFIHALNPTSGQEMWKSSPHKGKSQLTGAVAGGNSVVYGSRWGGLYVVDATNGKLIKRHITWGGVYSTPIACDGKVYILNGRGQIEAYSIN